MKTHARGCANRRLYAFVDARCAKSAAAAAGDPAAVAGCRPPGNGQGRKTRSGMRRGRINSATYRQHEDYRGGRGALRQTRREKNWRHLDYIRRHGDEQRTEPLAAAAAAVVATAFQPMQVSNNSFVVNRLRKQRVVEPLARLCAVQADILFAPPTVGGTDLSAWQSKLGASCLPLVLTGLLPSINARRQTTRLRRFTSQSTGHNCYVTVNVVRWVRNGKVAC